MVSYNPFFVLIMRTLSSQACPIEIYLKSKTSKLWFTENLQVGIGLLVLQQLSGINGVLFYSTSIFANAGYDYN